MYDVVRINGTQLPKHWIMKDKKLRHKKVLQIKIRDKVEGDSQLLGRQENRLIILSTQQDI